MNAKSARMEMQWIKLVSGTQVMLLLLATGWHYYLAPDGSFSTLTLFAMMNLVLVTSLTFAAFLVNSNHPSVRLALIIAACSFGVLFFSQLFVESPGEDVAELVSWIISAAALAFILQRLPLPNVVFILLTIAILGQGASAISDLLDDGLLNQSPTLEMKLINLVSFPIAMAACYAGMQYIFRSMAFQSASAQTLRRRLSEVGFADLFSLWQRALPKSVKLRSMVAWYDLVARLDRQGEVLFMNHGYAPEPGAETKLHIPANLEPYRYPIQLYDLVARQVGWKGRDALEVSSGLGGGTLWIAQTYAPKSLTGLDLAASAISKCKRRYGSLGISFVTGDAQAMPFPDASFDILINVESSLNYPDMRTFLGEVHRVLRPGGYFLFADYRSRSKMTRLRGRLLEAPFETVMLEDVTAGILRGLEKESDRKMALVDRLAPRFLRNTMLKFAGLGADESGEYHQFVSGQKAYIAAVFRKSEKATRAPAA